MSVHDAHLLRVNASGYGKNFNLPANDTITDSYSHDSSTNPAAGHEDPLFLDSSSDITVEHDYVIGTGGAPSPAGIAEAWAIQADYGPNSYITIDRSYAEGVTNYDAFFGGCTSKNSDQNHFTVTNNAFSTNSRYGRAANWNHEDPSNVWSGNYLVNKNGRTVGPTDLPAARRRSGAPRR